MRFPLRRHAEVIGRRARRRSVRAVRELAREHRHLVVQGTAPAQSAPPGGIDPVHAAGPTCGARAVRATEVQARRVRTEQPLKWAFAVSALCLRAVRSRVHARSPFLRCAETVRSKSNQTNFKRQMRLTFRPATFRGRSGIDWGRSMPKTHGRGRRRGARRQGGKAGDATPARSDVLFAGVDAQRHAGQSGPREDAMPLHGRFPLPALLPRAEGAGGGRTVILVFSRSPNGCGHALFSASEPNVGTFPPVFRDIRNLPIPNGCVAPSLR